MPIGTQYKPVSIQPKTVLLTGIVIVAAGGIVDPALTITPGITVTRQDIGQYTLGFNDGQAVGFTVPVFSTIISLADNDPYTIALVNPATLKTGSTGITLEFSDRLGNFQNPDTGGGWSYAMARINTGLSVP